MGTGYRYRGACGVNGGAGRLCCLCWNSSPGNRERVPSASRTCPSPRLHSSPLSLSLFPSAREVAGRGQNRIELYGTARPPAPASLGPINTAVADLSITDIRDTLVNFSPSGSSRLCSITLQRSLGRLFQLSRNTNHACDS